MPRKKRTIVDETLPDNDNATVNEDLTDLVCVLSKVYRINTGGRSFCFQSVEPVDEVIIQERCPNGGKFVVVEYNSMNAQLGTTHVEIEPKPITTINGNNNSGDDLRTRLLLDELNFTRNMMLKMIENFSNGGKAAATPLGELAQAMQTVHQLTSGNNPTELILKGMELGLKANGGSADWKSALVESAKDLIPPVLQAMGTRQPQPLQVQPTMITQPPVEMMKQGLSWIKPQIIGGMTVELAVGWLIQNVKDNPMCQQLMANAIQGDINTFITIDPEIANEPFRTWFTNAIQRLKEEWNAAQNPDTDDNERGTWDDTNGAADEKIGVGKPNVVKIG